MCYFNLDSGRRIGWTVGSTREQQQSVLLSRYIYGKKDSVSCITAGRSPLFSGLTGQQLSVLAGCSGQQECTYLP